MNDVFDSKEFKEFCIRNNIKEPKILLDRSKSDYLSQSIKTSATKDASLLGLKLFRVYNYNKLHIVDKTDYYEKVSIIHDKLKNKNFRNELKKIIDKNRLETLAFSSKLSNRYFNNHYDKIKSFISFRKKRAIIKYFYEVFRRWVTNEIQNFLIENNIKNKLSKYLFLSTKPLLEFVSHNKYIELVNAYNIYGKGSKVFLQQLNNYYYNFSNLDMKSPNQEYTTIDELLYQVKCEKKENKKITYDLEFIKKKKRTFFINTYYQIKPIKRLELKRIETLADDLDWIIYQESWGRQAWSRLNLSISDSFAYIENRLKLHKQYVKPIEEYELNEFLNIIENIGGIV